MQKYPSTVMPYPHHTCATQFFRISYFQFAYPHQKQVTQVIILLSITMRCEVGNFSISEAYIGLSVVAQYNEFHKMFHL